MLITETMIPPSTQSLTNVSFQLRTWGGGTAMVSSVAVVTIDMEWRRVIFKHHYSIRKLTGLLFSQFLDLEAT